MNTTMIKSEAAKQKKKRSAPGKHLRYQETIATWDLRNFEQAQPNTCEANGCMKSLDPLILKQSAALYELALASFCRERMQLSRWQKEEMCDWHASHLCDSPEQPSHPKSCL